MKNFSLLSRLLRVHPTFFRSPYSIKIMSGGNEKKKVLPVVASSEFFKVSFSHKFSNFNLKMALRKPELVLSSPHFFFDGLFWSFKLHVNDDPGRNIGLYLQSYCGPDPLTAKDRQIEIDARFYLFVKTDAPGIENESIIEHFIVEKKLIDSSSTHGTEIGGSCFIQKPKLLKHPFVFVPDNVLTVGCQLIWRTPKEIVTTFPALAKPFPIKADSFEKFFNQPKFNDLKIIVGDKKFYASKLLLSEASDVFQDIVENLPESAANSIEVNDVDIEAFENVLRFIHFKAIPDLQLSADAENWLKIADKFHFLTLKDILQKGFFLQLEPSNAITCLKISHKYSAADLKSKSLVYVQRNWTELVEEHNTEGLKRGSTWEESEECHDLLLEITGGLPSIPRTSRMN